MRTMSLKELNDLIHELDGGLSAEEMSRDELIDIEAEKLLELCNIAQRFQNQVPKS